MREIVFDQFIYNNQVLNTSEFENVYKDISPSVYEVIRIMDGVPLFFEEHYHRLVHSTNLLNHKINITFESMKANIMNIVKLNKVLNNNLKIIVNNLENDVFDEYYFFIHSTYPDSQLYSKGIQTITYQATRKNPNAKVIYQTMRDEINHKLKEKNCYEALLVDDNNNVTEGSRSNLFFIGTDGLGSDQLYTAPAKDVLIGVTRKKIIDLCKANAIQVVETPISLASIKGFSAGFISGTSPKILPISEIDNHSYDLENPLLQRIILLYNDEINHYIKTAKILSN
jgi:branched-chain amino acid aminotransferase